eukprot:3616178-Pyramimonas_sp.AAC.1
MNHWNVKYCWHSSNPRLVTCTEKEHLARRRRSLKSVEINHGFIAHQRVASLEAKLWQTAFCRTPPRMGQPKPETVHESVSRVGRLQSHPYDLPRKFIDVVVHGSLIPRQAPNATLWIQRVHVI